MRWLLIAVAVVSFVIYGHAIRRVFSRDHGVDRRMARLQSGGIASAVVHVWAISITAVPMNRGVLSLVAYFGGLGVFYLARAALQGQRLSLAFSPDAPIQLLQTGIYSRIRHPFYTAYSLTWIGGVIAAPSVWTATTAAGMCSAYWWAAVLEERKFAASSLREVYEAYRKRAGMFWPGVGSADQRPLM